MNDLERKIAGLSLYQRWRVLTALARTHPSEVKRAIDRVTARGGKEDAGLGFRISEPAA